MVDSLRRPVYCIVGLVPEDKFPVVPVSRTLLAQTDTLRTGGALLVALY